MMSKNQNRKNHFSDQVQEAKSYIDNFSEEKAVDFAIDNPQDRAWLLDEE
ncbi:hypothetical protein [Streptococcus sobrinus]|uniref:Uncharacterized protein n=1 Tax=Streptococcus sobrinus W1703 TaxID=1227275 RepID=U2KPQ9_9STRE|nr:hypothetical protein [Streptococcus sobrinus]ERJ79194.1 hypothetical protein HMPREF1557_00013 [Streptococcus sobrinus W1703]